MPGRKRVKVRAEHLALRRDPHEQADHDAATKPVQRSPHESARDVRGRSAAEQAAWLGGERLQRAQRHDLTAQIGRRQGNQHLGKVVDRSDSGLATRVRSALPRRSPLGAYPAVQRRRGRRRRVRDPYVYVKQAARELYLRPGIERMNVVKEAWQLYDFRWRQKIAPYGLKIGRFRPRGGRWRTAMRALKALHRWCNTWELRYKARGPVGETLYLHPTLTELKRIGWRVTPYSTRKSRYTVTDPKGSVHYRFITPNQVFSVLPDLVRVSVANKWWKPLRRPRARKRGPPYRCGLTKSHVRQRVRAIVRKYRGVGFLYRNLMKQAKRVSYRIIDTWNPRKGTWTPRTGIDKYVDSVLTVDENTTYDHVLAVCREGERRAWQIAAYRWGLAFLGVAVKSLQQELERKAKAARRR
jgi:hypothetical protein